ncbi:hypothetical protein BGZ61DRAFT_176759 [Ilyonectria robusta]|uniref:uncharacterized protein n=1 Tax=Ilyonectria robusta TaxID=1079257 RepID=UPI001E8CAB0F|nr:uncharacterized protein BGZ61DRAFT_176759 [Ilyonectria robusta]KAH8656737.1 hypothetical protein BGZ61DRAFT_176759 [Ilyonectria robusta]
MFLLIGGSLRMLAPKRPTSLVALCFPLPWPPCGLAVQTPPFPPTSGFPDLLAPKPSASGSVSGEKSRHASPVRTPSATPQICQPTSGCPDLLAPKRQPFPCALGSSLP